MTPEREHLLTTADDFVTRTANWYSALTERDPRISKDRQFQKAACLAAMGMGYADEREAVLDLREQSVRRLARLAPILLREELPA